MAGSVATLNMAAKSESKWVGFTNEAMAAGDSAPVVSHASKMRITA